MMRTPPWHLIVSLILFEVLVCSAHVFCSFGLLILITVRYHHVIYIIIHIYVNIIMHWIWLLRGLLGKYWDFWSYSYENKNNLNLKDIHKKKLLNLLMLNFLVIGIIWSFLVRCQTCQSPVTRSNPQHILQHHCVLLWIYFKNQ